MKKFLLATASSAVMIMGSVSAANAQSMNYSAMEELFGEPVTTSANGSPQRVSEVALNMEILTAEEIKRTGARTVPEALRFLPGLDVRQIAFGQTEVGIRGYNQAMSERILVLVNGRHVYNDIFGQVVWDNIAVEMGEIKQIEVVKGPNTALFGFNAVSGVINIVTYNPLYDDKSSVTATVGTDEFGELSGVVTQKLTDNVAVKVSAGGYRKGDDFDDIDSLTGPNGADLTTAFRDPYRDSVAVDLWTQLSDNLQGQFEFTRNDVSRNDILVSHVPSQSDYEAMSFRGRLIGDTKFGLIEADVYHTVNNADYNLAFDALGASLTSTVQVEMATTAAKLSNTVEVGLDHIFRISGEYRESAAFMQNSAGPLVADDLRTRTWSTSVLWDWKATDKLRTSTAIRYDNFEMKPDNGTYVTALLDPDNPFTDSRYNQNIEEISVNLGASYQIDAGNIVRATFSRGADLPSFVELGFQNATTATTIFGDPATESSIVTNYELGYDHQIDAINGLFRGAIFYQESEDMQGSGNTSFTGKFNQQFVNLGDSEMYGIELGLQGQFKENWNWSANYTYVDVEDDLANDTEATSGDFSSVVNYEDTVANHIFNVTLGYQATNWRADVQAQYRSSFDDVVATAVPNQFDLVEVDDAVIVNASFGYDITDNITWSVSGSNLFDNQEQYVGVESESLYWTSLTVKF